LREHRISDFEALKSAEQENLKQVNEGDKTPDMLDYAFQSASHLTSYAIRNSM